jgi:hypothetical protein
MFNSLPSHVYIPIKDTADNQYITLGRAKQLFILKGNPQFFQNVVTTNLSVTGSLDLSGDLIMRPTKIVSWGQNDNNKMLVLWDGEPTVTTNRNSATNFYGFGANPGSASMRYQVPASSTHKWYNDTNNIMNLDTNANLSLIGSGGRITLPVQNNSAVKWTSGAVVGRVSATNGIITGSTAGDLAICPDSMRNICIGDVSGTQLKIFGSSGEVATMTAGGATFRNLLDDGNGNMTISNGIVTINSPTDVPLFLNTASGTNSKMKILSNNVAKAYYGWDSTSGVNVSNGSGNPILKQLTSNDLSICTQQNILDDGVGKMTIIRDSTYNDNIGALRVWSHNFDPTTSPPPGTMGLFLATDFNNTVSHIYSVNNLGAAKPLYLNKDGGLTGSVKTFNVTVDDGSGNMTVGGTFTSTGVLTANSTSQFNGNATFAQNITLSSTTSPNNGAGTGVQSAQSSGCFLDSRNLNMNFKAGSSNSNYWRVYTTANTEAFRVFNQTNPATGSKVATYNDQVIVDDGGGNMLASSFYLGAIRTTSSTLEISKYATHDNIQISFDYLGGFSQTATSSNGSFRIIKDSGSFTLQYGQATAGSALTLTKGLQLTPTGSLSSKNNILDVGDGTGTMSLNTISTTPATNTSTIFFNQNGRNKFQIGSFYSLDNTNTSASDHFWIYGNESSQKLLSAFTNGKLTTKSNNILDDGSGNITVTNHIQSTSGNAIYLDGQRTADGLVQINNLGNLALSCYNQRVDTRSNTLDLGDGTGNVIIGGTAASITFAAVANSGLRWSGTTNLIGRVTANDAIMTGTVVGDIGIRPDVISTVSKNICLGSNNVVRFKVNSSTGAVTTQNGSTIINTLDDGNGNVIIGSTGTNPALYYNNTITTAGTSAALGRTYYEYKGNAAMSSGCIVATANTASGGDYWDVYSHENTGGATLGSKLQVYTNGQVNTALNTLDNGSGNMGVAGNLSVTGTISLSATTTITKDVTTDGDAASHLIMRGNTTNTKQLRVGYNTTSDNGYIQSVNNSGNTTLKLNPLGGSVVTGNNTLDDSSGNVTIAGNVTLGNAKSITLKSSQGNSSILTATNPAGVVYSPTITYTTPNFSITKRIGTFTVPVDYYGLTSLIIGAWTAQTNTIPVSGLNQIFLCDVDVGGMGGTIYVSNVENSITGGSSPYTLHGHSSASTTSASLTAGQTVYVVFSYGDGGPYHDLSVPITLNYYTATQANISTGLTITGNVKQQRRDVGWYGRWQMSTGFTVAWIFESSPNLYNGVDYLTSIYLNYIRDTVHGDNWIINRGGVYSIVVNYAISFADTFSSTDNVTVFLHRIPSGSSSTYDTEYQDIPAGELLIWSGANQGNQYERSMTWVGYLNSNDKIYLKANSTDASGDRLFNDESLGHGSDFDTTTKTGIQFCLIYEA